VLTRLGLFGSAYSDLALELGVAAGVLDSLLGVVVSVLLAAPLLVEELESDSLLAALELPDEA